MRRPTPPMLLITAKQWGEHLATWRKILDLTSQDIAERAGVSRQTVSKIENGDVSVRYEDFIRVIRSVGLVDKLAEAIDPMETEFGKVRAEAALKKRVRK
ncbi:MAG TPA: helix-turn-helix domain-containing protein [Aquiluna sp.]